MSREGVIEKEAPQTCEECGAIAETRPYGVDGKEVCYPCGKKNPEEMKRRAGNLLFGEPL